MSAPSRIGAYPIEREVGRGGMGIVYLARDPRLGRAVAIKVLPDAFARDPERLSRFEREAQLLASLNHPNIAGIYGLEEAEGHRFLALEYVEGETLAERIERGPLALDEALDIARQIAAALEAAHERGIIHRDLKPGNVKLTPAGDVKVLDFGLAKGAGSAESSPDLSQSPTMSYSPTGVGVILGTAAYMSPEQARGKIVDRRTDIWSFGCVLWDMLTRQQLFSGETVSDTIAKILEREPDWSAIPAAVPEKVRDLLRRCLEKDARRRLRDIGDARIELEDTLAARTSTARHAAARPSLVQKPAVAYLVALAALGVAAFATLGPGLRSPPAAVTRLSLMEPEGAALDANAEQVIISPDGRTVAFVATDSSGTPHLWARSLDVLAARVLPGTENASKPFWSTDSRSIAFFADGKLKKVRLGGSVQPVCDAPNGRGGSWNAKGTIVFAPTGQSPLFAVSASGGAPRPVTTLDSTKHETAHRFPWFLPDGNRFLYVTLPDQRDGFQVRVGSLDGRTSRDLMRADGAPVYASPGHLLFLRGARLAAQRFDASRLRLIGEPTILPDIPGSSSASGYPAASVAANGSLVYLNGGTENRRLAWVDRAGREIATVPAALGQWEQGSTSPDGRTAAITRRASPDEVDIWLIDLERGVGTRFTYGPRENKAPVWSPDGSRIAFESNRTGKWEVFVKPANGATPEIQITKSSSQFKHPTGWSPDGRSLVIYQMGTQTGFDAWVVPADGSGPGLPYLQSPFDEVGPSISPNGRWMLYTSNESGRSELYVQSYPTPGHKYQVSTGGCAFGAFFKQGKEIGMLALDFQTLMTVPVLESGPTFRTGSPRVLFRLQPNSVGVGVSNDGERFLCAFPQGRSAVSITMLLDWRAALASASAEQP